MTNARERKPKPIKVCKIEGCERTGKIRRGLCGKHYQRWLNHGDPGTVLRVLDPGIAACNQLHGIHKSNAKKRGIEWGLTKEEFRQITSQNCFYCGTEPQRKHSSKKYNGGYIHNGIDRVDSNKGYALDNCVPCCSFCNWAKNATPVDEFLNNIARAYWFQVQQIEFT